MRRLHALRHAMRTRRTHRIDLLEVDRLAAGDRPGPGHTGLADLLDAARQPATADELAGEKAAVAAFSDARKRAAPRRRGREQTVRTVVAELVTAVALLAVCGTAAAARTGHLPADAQQHAHRLFSALGVPAPRTGPQQRVEPAPSGSSRPVPSKTSHAPHQEWCRSWRVTPTPTASWRELEDAAGGPGKIGAFCASVAPSTSPSRTPDPSIAPSVPSVPPSVPSSVPPSAPPSASPSATTLAPTTSAPKSKPKHKPKPKPKPKRSI